MPPKKAKLPDAQLQLIRTWIQEGLIENKDGKSQLRKIEFDVAMGSANKPTGEAAFPNWPKQPISKAAAIAVAASPWADAFVVTGNEQLIAYHKSQPAGVIAFPEGVIHDLRFSRNGSLILAAGGRGAHSGKAVLFDTKTGKRIAEIGNESDSVLSADLSANHQLVALGGPAKLLKIFATENGELLRRIEKHTDWVTAVAFSPDGKFVASGDRSGGLHVWESASGAIVFTLDEHKVRVTRLAWRADGQMLASAGDDGKLVLWDMKDGWASKVIDAHVSKVKTRYSRKTGVLGLDWYRDGRLVTVGRDRKLKIWSATGDRIRQVEKLDSLPLASSYLSDGKNIVIGFLDGRKVFVDSADGHTVPIPE